MIFCQFFNKKTDRIFYLKFFYFSYKNDLKAITNFSCLFLFSTPIKMEKRTFLYIFTYNPNQSNYKDIHVLMLQYKSSNAIGFHKCK